MPQPPPYSDINGSPAYPVGQTGAYQGPPPPVAPQTAAYPPPPGPYPQQYPMQVGT